MSICEAIEGEIRRLVFFQGLNGGRLTVAVDDPDDRLWPLSVDRDRRKTADSVEKVAPLSRLRQNCFIGRRGITLHDGTVIEWAGATVLLVQP